MATSADILHKYQYLRTHPINKVLIERILLPGLATQGKFAGASRGIKLPHGKDEQPQYIQLDEAAILIISWLESSRNLETSEVNKLNSIANNLKDSKHAVSTLTIMLQNKYHEMVNEPETNLTTAVRNNLESYRAHQQKQDKNRYSSIGYNPGTVIDTFNKTHKEVTRLMQSGAPAAAIATLLPIDHNSKTPIATQRAMAQIIASNLDRFTGARDLHLGKTPTSLSLQANSATKELEQIIKSSYPEHTDLLNYTGDSDFQKRFLTSINKTADSYVGARGESDRLEPYRKIRLDAARALPFIAPSMLELETTLFNTLDSANIEEARTLTNAILREIISSASNSPNTTQLVDTTLAKLNYKNDYRQLIIRTLNTQEFQFGIAYQTQSLNSSFETHRPNRFDRKLVRNGINPQHTQLTSEQLRDNFQSLLPPQPLPENNLDLENTVWEQYFTELRSDNPDQTRLTSLRNWLDSSHTTFRLDDQESKLASRSRFEHSFTSFASRTRHAQHEFYNKLFEIEENLPWNRGIKKALESYDKFVEWAVIPLPFTDKKLPLFRMFPWIADQWNTFKQTKTLSQLAKLNPNSTRYKLLTHYSKGNFTINGMFGSASREFWGKRVAQPMAKWANKRFQSGVFKYATKSISRTGTRFLLKVGGKTLAKFGGKAVLALTSAAGVVTSIIGIGAVIGMVIDLAILAKDFLKEFFRNADFRRKILGIGAVVTGVLSAFSLAPIGLFFAAIGALMLQTLLLSAGVALGLLAFFLVFFNIFTKLPWDIDSAPGRILTSIFCDESGEGDGSAASAAICIADILTKAGLNPLLASDVNSTLWQQIISALFPDTIKAIAKSASGQGAFQCVGLIAAGVTESGGAYWEPPNANQLDINSPPGYTYVSGVGSCQPGDAFVDMGGTYGHTGWIVEDAGAHFVCVDANMGSAGAVRNRDSCRYAKSKIDGCLKKI
jgi:hypothetical protein